MNVSILLSAVCLSLFISFEATLIKYLDITKYKVPVEQVVILVEVFKLLVSLVLYLYNKKHNEYTLVIDEEASVTSDMSDTSDTSANTDWDEFTDLDPTYKWNWRNTLLYLFPAAVYTVSNNVTFWALKETTPAMYTLFMNLKIPLTGILAFLFLGYKLTPRFLLSYTILCTSAILASFEFQNGIKLGISTRGLLYMLLYTSCSASGSILMEYITKIKYPYTSIYIQNVKYAIANVLCNAIVIAIRKQVPFTDLKWVHIFVIVTSGVYGLITGVVIKFGGSILKTYSVSTSVFVSAFLSWLIWHQHYKWNFYVGSVLCLYAVGLYAQEYYKVQSRQAPNREIILETEDLE